MSHLVTHWWQHFPKLPSVSSALDHGSVFLITPWCKFPNDLAIQYFSHWTNNMIFSHNQFGQKFRILFRLMISMHPADRTNSVHQPDLELLEGKHSILSSRNGNKPKCALLPNVWPFILFLFPPPPSHLRGLNFWIQLVDFSGQVSSSWVIRFIKSVERVARLTALLELHHWAS